MITMDLFNWEETKEFPCPHNSARFWGSVDIWICKPHCLNKKIGGVDNFELGSYTVEGIKKCIEYFSESLHSLQNCLDLKNSINTLIVKFHNTCQELNSLNSYKVILRFLYPKTGYYNPANVEIIIKDLKTNTVIFVKPVSDANQKLITSLPYAVSFVNETVTVYTTRKTTLDNDCNSWLSNILLPKLIWWMENGNNFNSLSSNRLISINKYLLTYSRLKEKYFNSILQFWEESTNPEKFISEDIAIASYLLVLWGDKINSFVDLGCGNGLLVYILTCEGHKGIGIDVRSRKIWNAFPKCVTLKEEQISPSLDCIFPEADWIIGNHSDELTLWIPIIAARSSYTANFFLLPCCPFELNGNKYSRNNTSKSSYSDYMDYLEDVCNICGINVERDRLKIPSTKRICFVSKERNYPCEDQFKQDNHIKKFLELKMKNSDEANVKLRSPVERVKNCTQLNKEYLEAVVLDIANFIIKSSSVTNSWREGEFVPLSELVMLLSLQRRKFLKDQCGGLQTLLKNHHHIFLVYNGRVKLRKPTERISLPKILKQKNCWFFFNHPDSCPLSDEQCTYKHLLN